MVQINASFYLSNSSRKHSFQFNKLVLSQSGEIHHIIISKWAYSHVASISNMKKTITLDKMELNFNSTVREIV